VTYDDTGGAEYFCAWADESIDLYEIQINDNNRQPELTRPFVWANTYHYCRHQKCCNDKQVIILRNISEHPRLNAELHCSSDNSGYNLIWFPRQFTI
jgi:hypothetical protein